MVMCRKIYDILNNFIHLIEHIEIFFTDLVSRRTKLQVYFSTGNKGVDLPGRACHEHLD